MSIQGQAAVKGFSFQDIVGVDYVLDLLKDDTLVAMEMESTGLPNTPDRIYVDDIVLRYNDGKKKFVQIKSSAERLIHWTMDQLNNAGELEKITKQLLQCRSNIVELICPYGFSDFEELILHATKSNDVVAMVANSSEAALHLLDRFCKYTNLNREDGFDCISRVKTGKRFFYEDWEENVLDRLARIVDEPLQALAILLKTVKDHQCKREDACSVITAQAIQAILREASIKLIGAHSADATVSTRDWRRSRDTVESSYGKNIVPIDGEEEGIEWKSEGCYLSIALRPKMPITDLSIDMLEEKLARADSTLPTFTNGLQKRVGRIDEGICAYEYWTGPTPIPTSWEKLLMKVSDKFRPAPEKDFIAFTYLCRNGELWMKYFFRKKRGYRDQEEIIERLPARIEQHFSLALDRARGTLRTLGIDEPYEGIAHICGGIFDSRIAILNEQGQRTGKYSYGCSAIKLETKFDIYSRNSSSSHVLKRFYIDLWEALKTSRPPHYNNFTPYSRLAERRHEEKLFASL